MSDQPKTRHDEMREHCYRYMREHPEVWEMFVKYTFEMINRGFKHYAAEHGIFSKIRWEVDKPDSNGLSTFKINNNYSSILAREFMRIYPQHDGFFRTRKLTSEDQPATGLPELTPAHFDEPAEVEA